MFLGLLLSDTENPKNIPDYEVVPFNQNFPDSWNFQGNNYKKHGKIKNFQKIKCIEVSYGYRKGIPKPIYFILDHDVR